VETITVEIFGAEYTIRATEPPEYIRELAKFVDERMRQIAEAGRVVSTSKIAVLAALQIADELFKTRASLEEPEGVKNQIDKLLQRIDGVISTS